MSRTTSTSWNDRDSISSTWETRTKLAYLLQETFDKLLQEDWNWILLEESISNIYTTPRYWWFLEDSAWEFVYDLMWEQVSSLQWNDVNVIKTVWS